MVYRDIQPGQHCEMSVMVTKCATHSSGGGRILCGRLVATEREF